MSNPSPNVKDTLKLLAFSNVINQPRDARWLLLFDIGMLMHLASLHISCCFLGFTCFLKTWRRPEKLYSVRCTSHKVENFEMKPEWQPAAALRSSGSNVQLSLNSKAVFLSFVGLDFVVLSFPSIITDDPPVSILGQPLVMTFEPSFSCVRKLLSWARSLTGFLGKLQAPMACFKASRERGHGEVYAGVA